MLAKPGETMTGAAGFYSLGDDQATPAQTHGIGFASTVAQQGEALVCPTRRRPRLDRQTGYFSRIILIDADASSRSTPMSTSARRLR